MRKTGIAAIGAAALLGLGSTAFAANIGPDAFGYVADDAAQPFNFQDISGTGTGLGLLDDGSASVGIGFTFDFYGTSYTSVFVNANGNLTFTGGSSEFTNEDLSGPLSTDLPTIAVYWDDLNPEDSDSDDIYVQTVGAPGSRRLIVQWNALDVFDDTDDTTTLQVILFEGTNDILFQYLDVTIGVGNGDGGGLDDHTDGASATIGIRDAGGHLTSRFLQWGFDTPGSVTSGDAILFSTSLVVTPEPGSIALLSLGLLGLGGVVARRRRRA